MREAFNIFRRRLGRLAAAVRSRRPAQAMTEVVLLFPVFMVILFVTAKIFALLVLVQKMEIASFYAARRWQLESHLNADWAAKQDDRVQRDIEEKVKEYLGFSNPAIVKFLNLQSAKIEIQRTQVWNVVTLKVSTRPRNIKLMCKYSKEVVCSSYGQDCRNGYDYLCVEPGNHQNGAGKTLEVTKYVPSRDRPIAFELPGAAE